MGNMRILIVGLACLAFVSIVKALSHEPELGSARVVFQTSYGDIGFYPTAAPKTVDHIFKLVRLGGYNTNHFFRKTSNKTGGIQRYAAFGKVTKGDETSRKLEEVPTRREGIFIMSCEEERSVLKRRLQASVVEVERQVTEMSIDNVSMIKLHILY
ncbi:hypothetical protein ARALYDRAFT_890296 [Arabidopsis lyrata subsp. lyrata]|uniref:Uncharacterized protein n=1 Tax=Arabidopsis lyrata subsp. lyrata TaxID=81972 RepID=D7KBS7_ARALL|nr:hypothetical protein ARALYDRAFT_890296 [Arabidopsis lyrata subsp. lyrata]